MCMLIDHICVAFFSDVFFAGIIRDTIGRMAFPLFAFMLCDGFFHTKSKKNYLLNLFIFALISEVPYDLMFSGRIINIYDQNTIFTLFLSLLMLVIIDRFEGRLYIQLLLAAVFCAIGYFSHIDYSFYGIASIAIIYFFKFIPPHLACGFSCLPLLVGYKASGAFLACIPLFFYNKLPGKKSPAIKYGFYLFYPVHLIIILLIRYLL